MYVGTNFRTLALAARILPKLSSSIPLAQEVQSYAGDDGEGAVSSEADRVKGILKATSAHLFDCTAPPTSPSALFRSFFAHPILSRITKSLRVPIARVRSRASRQLLGSTDGCSNMGFQRSASDTAQPAPSPLKGPLHFRFENLRSMRTTYALVRAGAKLTTFEEY